MKSKQDNVLNVLNITCRLEHILHVRIITVNMQDEVDIDLYTHKAYKITYITEHGVREATGILVDIIPDYKINQDIIHGHGNVNFTLKMDCSLNGRSDIRKIPVRAIRNIDEVHIDIDDDDDDNIFGNIYYEEIDSIVDPHDDDKNP